SHIDPIITRLSAKPVSKVSDYRPMYCHKSTLCKKYKLSRPPTLGVQERKLYIVQYRVRIPLTKQIIIRRERLERLERRAWSGNKAAKMERSTTTAASAEAVGGHGCKYEEHPEAKRYTGRDGDHEVGSGLVRPGKENESALLTLQEELFHLAEAAKAWTPMPPDLEYNREHDERGVERAVKEGNVDGEQGHDRLDPLCTRTKRLRPHPLSVLGGRVWVVATRQCGGCYCGYMAR
ncbi:7793_t:CDS:2, partial [Acaulospora colombiana]